MVGEVQEVEGMIPMAVGPIIGELEELEELEEVNIGDQSEQSDAQDELDDGIFFEP
jgi:hypothetical protein